MRQLLQKLGNSLKAGLLTGATVGLAVLLPVAVFAQNPPNPNNPNNSTELASPARLDGNFGIANVTNGDIAYASAVNATQGHTLKLQVYYVNTEAADSDKPAQNVRLKVTVPTGGSKAQTISSSVKGDNTDPVDKQVTVNIDRDDAILQYVPGSAVWKHNTGTAEAPKIEETSLSDAVVTGAQGLVLESQKPGENFGATVSVLVKVSLPGVVVTSQSQLKGQTGQWSAGNTAKPGDTMRYLISYQNSGTSQQRNVLIRTKLPDGVVIVPGSTILTNATSPAGVKVDNDNVATSGITVGNYGAGANAFVSFEATLPAVDKLRCGTNELRNVAIVKPETLDEYYGSSVTSVTRKCAPTSATPASPTAPTPPAPSTAPTALPDTGAGEAILIFIVTAILGAVGHRYFLVRRLP